MKKIIFFAAIIFAAFCYSCTSGRYFAKADPVIKNLVVSVQDSTASLYNSECSPQNNDTTYGGALSAYLQINAGINNMIAADTLRNHPGVLLIMDHQIKNDALQFQQDHANAYFLSKAALRGYGNILNAELLARYNLEKSFF